MAGSTRLEINFNRLLHRCEAIASDEQDKSWRLEKYIGALQDKLAEMKKAHSRPSQDTLTEYNKKVELLKGLIAVEKMPCGAEKMMATDRLQPVTSSSPGSAPTRKLQARAKVVTQQDMRTELLGNGQESEMRHRGGAKSGGDGESDIDSLLQHHHRIQERLAEEMLHHARALKENISNAGVVVREDTVRLGDNQKLADTNTSRLAAEKERLTGFNQSCSWWIWIMLFVVLSTFLAMIIFMKLFPK